MRCPDASLVTASVPLTGLPVHVAHGQQYPKLSLHSLPLLQTDPHPVSQYKPVVTVCYSSFGTALTTHRHNPDTFAAAYFRRLTALLMRALKGLVRNAKSSAPKTWFSPVARLFASANLLMRIRAAAPPPA